MEAITTTPAGEINCDIPCAACGYNLRGLQPTGRCPECGGEIGPSVHVHQLRQMAQHESLVLADPRWVRSLAEGATLSVLAMLLILGMALAPDWAWKLKTQPRVVMLYIACTAWVLAWYGVWKLTTRERGVFADLRIGEVRRVVLRVGATAQFLVPFVWAWFRKSHSPLGPTIMLTLLLGGFVACVAYYVHLGGLLRRSGAHRLAWFVRFIALLNVVLWFFGLMPELGGGHGGSLEVLLDNPTVHIGPAELLIEIIRSVVSPYRYPRLLAVLVFLLLLAVAAAQVTASATLWATVFRRCEAAGAQKAAASSRP